MIKKLTAEQREALEGFDARDQATGAWLGAGRGAVRVIDQLTEALEAERAETADWLQVSRDWRVRAEDAEAQVRDFKVRHAAASSILAGAGTFLDSAALEALQGPAPAAAPSSRPRAALRRLRAMLLERGEAELIRLVDLALKDGAG